METFRAFMQRPWEDTFASMMMTSLRMTRLASITCSTFGVPEQGVKVWPSFPSPDSLPGTTCHTLYRFNQKGAHFIWPLVKTMRTAICFNVSAFFQATASWCIWSWACTLSFLSCCCIPELHLQVSWSHLEFRVSNLHSPLAFGHDARPFHGLKPFFSRKLWFFEPPVDTLLGE